jgi:molybdopterin-guanine dinucleotide biosynthesis protein A
MTAAIVLAGGASSRFKGDKLEAELRGRPVLHHALAAAAEVAPDLVLVIGPRAHPPRLPEALAARTTIARDREEHQGPLAGLDAGLATLVRSPGDRAGVAVVVGGDQPWLAPAVLGLMVATLEADPELGAVTLEARPPASLPMVVRPALVAPVVAILLREGRRALRSLPDRVPTVVVGAAAWRPLDPGGDTLRDVDLPEDLDAARHPRR